ncbi:hypothetical protein GCM10023143_00740 [Compostibacter hankyongensis]|uniref:Glycoside hydrolase n=1 Tax=Compostibacter hankyongensis TaxID=1007089 RepID=A0ABP8FBX9_9BACT
MTDTLPGDSLRTQISHADLDYDHPAPRSEAGMPVGNGRMGSLVWTVPSALCFQLNRVDIFGNDFSSHNFYERNTDYCGGAGFVNIDFGDMVFGGAGFRQHLSCYDGAVTVQKGDVRASVLAWDRQDVMAVQVQDRRRSGASVHADLRMLRPAAVHRGDHRAESAVKVQGDRIVLTQAFREGKYYCGSAVVIGAEGCRVKAEQVNESTVRLYTEPQAGKPFSFFMASAAGFDPGEDLVAAAMHKLDAAQQRGFGGLQSDTRGWWHRFWQRGTIRLHSTDGVADDIEKHYNYYLYVMASASRGRYPAKFNGMIWTTGGDTRQWGGLYWGANQSCLYNALLPSLHPELLDPMFGMYSDAYASYALAARQQWGSRGIYIPETGAFNGVPALPDSIAREMRSLYLMQKPWEQRSRAFRNYAATQMPYFSRWNWTAAGKWVDGRWVAPDRGGGPYGPVTHIFSRSAKIAYQYWQQYEYTLDTAWLRRSAYPMIKGMAEFYRSFPNLKKEKDGKYHIRYVNDNEPVWGGHNTAEEISAMLGILPAAISASKILGVDADLRAGWKELLQHLSPLSLSAAYPEATGAPTWVKSLPPVVKGNGRALPDPNTLPQWFFDLCNPGAPAARLKTANATYDAYFRQGIGPRTSIYVLSRLPVAGAILGRADAVRYLIPNQIHTKEAEIMANRMDQREGRQTTNVQRLGRAAEALEYALCQSAPPEPAGDPVIRLFPAWPAEWEASFTLRARGGFLVSAAQRKGRTAYVKLVSEAGATCRVLNPWPGRAVTLYRDGKKAGALRGRMLTLSTGKGEHLLLMPEGTAPDIR